MVENGKHIIVDSPKRRGVHFSLSFSEATPPSPLHP